MNNSFRQSLLGRPSPVGRQSFAGRQSILGRSGSSIPRPTATTTTTGSGSTNSNASGGIKLGSGLLHSSRPPNEVFHFPILKHQAIISCLADLSVSWTEEDLTRPSPQKVLLVYETFLEVAMGRQRDDCSLEDVQNMGITLYPEFTVDSIRFYAFLHQLSNMMYELGVTDFTSRDVTKPEPERVRRLLSAVINFAKFKEDRQAWFFQELRATDEILETIDKCERENEELRMKHEAIRQRDLADGPKVEEIKTANKNLAAELEAYKKQEMQTTRLKDEVSKERTALTEQNNELGIALEISSMELSALKAQRVDVPETLEQDLIQLPESIQATQTKMEQYRKQVQKGHADVERVESVLRDLTKVRDMMKDMLKFLEQSQNDKLEVDSVKSQIEKENLMLSTLRMKLEQVDRQTKMLEEKSMTLMKTQQQRRLQQEQEIAELEKTRQEWEVKVQESRRVLEEKKRKQAEILQREEQWAKEATEAMELLKHQFECYMSEVLPAIRLN
ncbi:kinetochore-associated Ndc80 complex subunit nuf2 [Modicella reniformis]|uniref:Kinetochore-associated Ndc80 complex subunit nuf2 n=1 Tax=Modicella reniformis TaxID=1440133 RepID=A0A9P6J221_9FUNG|nr:kinetochore-associated Ndc80 complex subunit nuf2 [Modicella reniformis]